MKNLYQRLAIVACLILLAATPALAGYYHETMNPEVTAATDAADLSATCRLLAADVTNQRPIYIDCDDVAGLSSSATIANGGTITTIDINGGTVDGAVIGGASIETCRAWTT